MAAASSDSDEETVRRDIVDIRPYMYEPEGEEEEDSLNFDRVKSTFHGIHIKGKFQEDGMGYLVI